MYLMCAAMHLMCAVMHLMYAVSFSSACTVAFKSLLLIPLHLKVCY